MCEKPMAKSAADARRMVEAAKETGKKLTIGYQHRHKAESQYVKACIERGDLGEIYYAKALAIRRRGTPNWGVFLNEYEQGGGPLIDIGTHSLDVTLYLMNNYKPRMVVGTKYKKVEAADQGNPWGGWAEGANTVEDSAFGFIVMENGATIVLESAWALNTLDVREAITTLCGTLAGGDMNDGIRINGIRNNLQYVLKPDLAGKGAAFFEGNAGEAPADREARLWIEAIVNETEPCVKPEEAYTVTRILEGIYTSAKTGDIYRFD
jgi:predicted dehydrogenase